MWPSTYRPLPLLVGLLLTSGALGTASVVHAQGSGGQSIGAQDVDEPVAAALYDRGMVLFEQGDVASAKKMFSESLGRSPSGSRAADALRMLRECNKKLGVQDLDAGRPLPTTSEGPLDPYGAGPLDPYADPGTDTGAGPMDPYGDGGGADLQTDGPSTPRDDSEERAGSLFMAHGGLQGFMAGMALLGPYDEDETTGEATSLQGGSIALGFVGAGGAIYLSHYLADKKSLTETQGNVIGSFGFWGMYNGAHLGNIFAGEDSNANDIYTGMAVTGLIGSGIGYWYAKEKDPSEGELAFANSLTLYGTSGGLLFGVAIDPPRGDAYSLNALVGSGLGLGVAYYAHGHRPTRRRMLKVDLGGAIGALAPWILVYPFTADSSTKDDEQLVGLLSVMGLAAGAYGTWRYTEGETEEEAAAPASPDDGAPPAFVQRKSSGAWTMSTPAIRPMEMPALAPRRGISFGTDIVSGRF